MKAGSGGRAMMAWLRGFLAALFASLALWPSSLVAAPSPANLDNIQALFHTSLSNANIQSYLTSSLPGCALARSLDDYNDNPSVGSIQDQERRADAYAACRKALHKTHAPPGVLKVNTLLQARACIVLGGMGGPAGTYPACN